MPRRSVFRSSLPQRPLDPLLLTRVEKRVSTRPPSQAFRWKGENEKTRSRRAQREDWERALRKEIEYRDSLRDQYNSAQVNEW